MSSKPNRGFGVPASQATQAYKNAMANMAAVQLSNAQNCKNMMAAIGAAVLEEQAMFSIIPWDDSYLIAFFDPKRSDDIYEWFEERGYKPASKHEMGISGHFNCVDKQTAMLAKLTWGGAQ